MWHMSRRCLNDSRCLRVQLWIFCILFFAGIILGGRILQVRRSVQSLVPPTHWQISHASVYRGDLGFFLAATLRGFPTRRHLKLTRWIISTMVSPYILSRWSCQWKMLRGLLEHKYHYNVCSAQTASVIAKGDTNGVKFPPPVLQG